MRRNTMLSLAIAGLFLLASAAVAGANWYHQSESSGGNMSEMTSPSSEPEAAAPEVGAYERQEATEAGKLPSEGAPVISAGEIAGPDGFRNQEFGGYGVREGLDSIP